MVNDTKTSLVKKGKKILPKEGKMHNKEENGRKKRLHRKKEWLEKDRPIVMIQYFWNKKKEREKCSKNTLKIYQTSSEKKSSENVTESGRTL